VFVLLWGVLASLAGVVLFMATSAYADLHATVHDLDEKVDAMQRELYEVKGDVKWLRYDRAARGENP
jgi:cell division protein FtsL